jgi:chitin disaccharide deacetylase
MIELILNADDFGLTRGVNEGIIRAHRDGILTSATLMANGLAFEDAVERARAVPSLGVGCHLVLVGGRAISAPDDIPSLVDREGKLPGSLGSLVTRLSAGFIREKHIEREFHAQIKKIRRAGIEPTHLDTHKHTHAHPRVMERLGRVAQDLGIRRVRKPIEDLRDSWKTTRLRGTSSSAQILAAAVRAVAPCFRSILRRYGLRSPDHFLGLVMTGRLDSAALRCMIDTLREGRTEIMLHPGLADADLAQTGSRLQDQRLTELEALMDPEIKSILTERRIRLISFRELN